MDKKEIVDIQPSEISTVTPMDMLQTAIEKGADLDQLEKFMSLAERWQDNEAKKAYIEAMNKFREECPVIERTRKAHNSSYAGLAETIEEIKSLLSDCGLSHSWKTSQENGETTVTCCVTHVKGHQECTSLTAANDKTGSKNDIQAMGSTVSYLQRYTLFSILGIASKEMDNDGNDRVTFEQAEELEKLADEAGVDKSKFLVYFQCGSFNHIPAKQYKNALAAIKQKAKKQKAEK